MVADLLQVRYPLIDDPSLVRLAEVVGDEALETPFAIRDVSAADHEDQLLAAALRDRRKVIVEARDRLEVDVELDGGGIDPVLAIRRDESRTDGRAVVAVHIEERLQTWAHRFATDAKCGCSYLRVAPACEASAGT